MTPSKHSRIRTVIAALVAAGVCALLLPAIPARQGQPAPQEDLKRDLWNKQFEQARTKAGKPASAGASQNKPAGHVAGNPQIPTAPPASQPAPQTEAKPAAAPAAAPALEVSENDLIGVTLWRLREASRSERSLEEQRSLEERLLVQQEFIAERIKAATKFDKGQRVRLSIEIPRAGENFLYVIDRELYANGATSEPYLIFPSRTVNNGVNAIRAGRISDLPTLTDKPPYFTLVSERQDYAGEQLTFIVSPQRLELPTSQGPPLALNEAQTRLLREWEKDWDKTAESRESAGTLGVKWTTVEKEAGQGQRLLVQGDPLPQTIYRVKAAPDGRLLIVVPLRIAQ